MVGWLNRASTPLHFVFCPASWYLVSLIRFRIMADWFGIHLQNAGVLDMKLLTDHPEMGN